MAESQPRLISDELYAELHETYFSEGGSADKYFVKNGMEEQRRLDIEDTFTNNRAKFAEIFPEIALSDPSKIDRAAAIAAFFERTGFEDGIDFWARHKPYSPMSDEAVARRHKEAVAPL